MLVAKRVKVLKYNFIPSFIVKSSINFSKKPLRYDKRVRNSKNRLCKELNQ